MTHLFLAFVFVISPIATAKNTVAAAPLAAGRDEAEAALRLRVEALRWGPQMDAMSERIASLQKSVLQAKADITLDNNAWSETDRPADQSRVPTEVKDGDMQPKPLSLFKRLRHLERKVDGSFNWLKSPQTGGATCKDQKVIGRFPVCFDGALSSPEKAGRCVVYEMGIGKEPDFGQQMMSNHGCTVHAYDPSPRSVEWWDDDAPPTLRAAAINKRYSFSSFAAGGFDGTTPLFDYEGGQLSPFKAENDFTKRPAEANIDGLVITMDVRTQTLRTMMRENMDDYIDVLKLDIEGSEYLFLQEMFDTMGCPPVGQIVMEWHHFSADQRYGVSPEVNALNNFLAGCGYKAFHASDPVRRDINATQAEGHRFYPPMRFMTISYCKNCFN